MNGVQTLMSVQIQNSAFTTTKSNELSSHKLVPKVVPPADKIDTSRQELELPFHYHITMLRSTCYNPVEVKNSLNLPDSQTDAKSGSVDGGFIASVVSGGVDVDYCGGGVKDGNDCGMTT
ncbi:hypothetical protein Tco_0368433 [Tanacetum coccineum]